MNKAKTFKAVANYLMHVMSYIHTSTILSFLLSLSLMPYFSFFFLFGFLIVFCSVMAKEDLLRTCLVWLAAVMLAVGLWTHSLNKVFVTYVVGILGISGILLPDWDFFNRDFSQWMTPVSSDQRASTTVSGSDLTSFSKSPFRVAAYIAVYSFALYKWWMFISN